MPNAKPPADQVMPAVPDCRALLENLIANAGTGISISGPDGRIVYANGIFCEMLGLAPGECVGLKPSDIVRGESTDAARAQMRALAAGEIDSYHAERLFGRKDGGSFWGRVRASIVRNRDTGGVSYFVFQLEDIDRQKAAEAALVKNQSRLDYALESAGQGVWDYDFNTKEMYYSRTWRDIRGFGPDEAIDGRQEVWLARLHPDDRERIRETVRQQDAGEIDRNAFEYRERHRDGRWIWILSRGKVIEWNADGSPARVIGTDTDITRLKEEEARRVEETAETFRQNLAKIEKAHEAAEAAQQLALSLARHDALTGLPNRRVFSEALEKALARSSRGAGAHAVLQIDLDRFKPVNDIHGHAAGDAVLCEVARRLREVVRAGDTVARMGGDEFAVIMECAADASPAEAAIQLARRVIDVVGQPIQVGDFTAEVGASIGIATCPLDGLDPETLLRAADMAMYRAKQEGRGTFRFFQNSMEAELRVRAALEADVRRAVAGNEIQPYYQPLMQLAESRLVGFEILARWHHPVRGDVPPDVFIPVIEQLGLIAEFTYALLRRACNDARTWPSDITISLNVSPLHLSDPVLPVKILAILSETGFPPKRLEIEVTESAVASDVAVARTAIATLRGLGIKIALDDFGTGYSTLNQLREFHFDKIKIDRSFVQSMETDAGNARLVRSILDLARNLGLPTIAEGIEHRDAIRQIVEGGGEFGQGYYFGKAMPASDAEAMTRAGANKKAG